MNKIIKTSQNLRKVFLLGLLVLACGITNLHAQSIIITGTVTNSKGEPAPFVNVFVKGQPQIGAETQVDGKYTITVPNSNVTLVFSSVEYQQKEMAINNQTVINVTLETSADMLDQVVVVGFGTQKKESVVGAIQTISSKELRVPSSQLSNAFAGKVAGVISVQRTGEPGADGANFWIRGISTFGGGTQPLIFIDGVEVGVSDMNALAPEVIENFSILKDATATALYGARGANGVMLITTRQGRNMEKAKINLRFENQFAMPTKLVKFADGVDYMEMWNEARLTRGLLDTRFDQTKIDRTRAGEDPLLYPNINWQDVLFKDFSMNQSFNMNVTGGGSRVVYFMSATLNNDNGLLKKDSQNQFNNNIRQLRFGFQGNIGADLTKTTKATLRLNTQILDYGGSHISTADIYSYLWDAPGVLFPAYFPNTNNQDHILFGNLEGGPHPQVGANLYKNPYAHMVTGYKDRNANTNIVSFELDQDLKFLTEGLSVKGMISFKNWSQTNVTRGFTPTYYQPTNIVGNNGVYEYDLEALNKGTTALSTSSDVEGDRLMNLQFMTNYARSFGKHDVSGMLVYLQRDYNNNNPGTDYYKTLATRNHGLAGRATYAYDNRYMIEANFGYNGSENFEDGKRYGFFPSFAAGYNISNEAFWEPLKKVVTSLKIRGSWGIVGNSEISSSTDDRFPYLTFVNLSAQKWKFGNEWQTERTGAKVKKYGAIGARWEEGTKSNIGMDMTLFNALSITVDAYHEKREGIFMRRRTTPIESGVSGDLSPFANLGIVTNKGIDIALDFNKAFLNNELIVNVRGTFTYAKNRLDDRDEPKYEFAYQSDIGKALNMNKGLVALGLFKDQADVDNSPRQTFSQDVAPGDIKYKDMNGDGQVDANDMTRLGDPYHPQINYGFGLSASYKGFDASIFFQGVAKTSLMMYDFHPFNSNYSQLYKFIADDYWSESNQNPNAAYPRLVQGVTERAHNNHQPSDFWQRNGSFLRLKNVEIGYTYKFLRAYVTANNLLTFSSFKYWDPELGGVQAGVDGKYDDSGSSKNRARGTIYPNLRVFSVGLQFTF